MIILYTLFHPTVLLIQHAESGILTAGLDWKKYVIWIGTLYPMVQGIFLFSSHTLHITHGHYVKRDFIQCLTEIVLKRTLHFTWAQLTSSRAIRTFRICPKVGVHQTALL